MASDASNPARGEAAGLGDGHLLGGDDSSQSNLSLTKRQQVEPARRDRALLSVAARYRRELLLDAIAEGCGDVIDCAESAERFVVMREREALFAAVDGLVAKAIVVGEAKRDLLKLLAGQSEAPK
jgi:hypothetical protein